ncbi:hypothetical protein [Leptospira paudalimensis]|uniref:Glycosyltransferase RgtA/B/C/D-like domain-containing protein n=1 Tax=Leptospira paudalimensis TaxID=2950024 RepID=A0ABT3M5V2_9LEPT|nr:hypothetical protein [Leptospira paudalimensis]MCW7503755.1 hypothetical protein [Leptospira paudalimensis]
MNFIFDKFKLLPSYLIQIRIELFIFFISFLVRLIWVLNIDSYPTLDGYAYYSNAYSLANDGKVDFYWPVGYSAILALFMKLGISKLFYFKLLNVIFSSLSVVIGYKIVNHYIQNSVKRILAVFLLVFYPEFIFFNSLFWSETVFIFLLLLSFYLLILNKIKLSAIGLAISIFVKPIAILIPVVFCFIHFPSNQRRYFLVISYTIILIFHLPWMGFNYQQTGKLGLVSNNGPTNLFIGNNQYATGHYDEEGLRNISKFPTDDLKKNVFQFWTTYYQDIPLLVSKKISYLLFGMPSPWIWSVGIGTNVYSQLPRYLTIDEFQAIKTKIKNNNILESCYQLNEKINLYSLNASADDYTKATMANNLIFTGVVTYKRENQLLLLSEVAFFLNVLLILVFLMKVVYFGIRRIPLFFVPIYFLVFYCFFFGDFRFFLPAIPFLIIGNFLPKK